MAQPGGAATTSRRRPLDGLRTVAVYLVVLFHAGVGRASGGFIGVGVFFVLSGYLVTQVILRDRERHGGTRFAHFYSRRVRRLLPAALLTLLVIALTSSALATPVERAETLDAVRAALLYGANWFFIGQSTDYFAADLNANPVLHFWSLAVEEQFYVVWPLLLTGILVLSRRVGRRLAPVRRHGPVLAVGVLGLASAGLALALRTGEPSRAYFGTDTRAYQLLAGALLALLPQVVRRASRRRAPVAVVTGLALLAVLVLATDLISVDPIVRGIAVTVATLALITGLDAVPGSPVARVLSIEPVVYLGQISYGTYLWHWPVALALDDLIELSTPSRVAVIAVVATALAALSHRLLEAPIRLSPRLDRVGARPVVVAGLALSLVAALVVVPAIDVRPAEATAEADLSADAGFTPIPDDFNQFITYNEGYGDTVECVDGAPEDCTVVEGEGTHILLMGDSNAQMMVPAFTRLAEQEGLRLSLAVTSGCPWQRDRYTFTAEIQAKCRRTKADAYDRVIPALDPDVIVLLNSTEADPAATTDPRNGNTKALKADTEASLEALRDRDRQIVMLSSAPRPVGLDEQQNPLECMAEATFVEECRFVVPTQPTWYEAFKRGLAEDDPQLTVVDIGPLICPFRPICDPIIDGQVVWWNEAHITRRFSETLAPGLADELRAQGVLDG